MRPKQAPVGGRLIKEKTTKPKSILPPLYRNNPALDPSIPLEDTRSGLLSLVERGFVKSTDRFSTAISLCSRPVNLLPAEEQFKRKNQIQDSRFGFDFSAFKLDLSTPRIPAHLQKRSESQGEEEVGNKPHKRSQSAPEFSSHFPEIPANYQPLTSIKSDPEDPPKPPETKPPPTTPHPQTLRSFSEIMDTTAKHTLLFKNSSLLPSPELESFQRLYAAYWKDVTVILNLFGNLLRKFQIFGTIFISGQELIKLSFIFRSGHVINDRLFLSLVIDDSKHKLQSILESVYAAKIQAHIRGFFDRRNYIHFKNQLKAVNIISKYWQRFVASRSARQLADNYVSADISRFKQMYLIFCQNFRHVLFSSKRLHLVYVPTHIGSTATWSKIYPQNFNSQNISLLGSLCDVRDGDQKVGVSLLTSVDLDNQTQTHFSFVLTIGRADSAHRARFVVPRTVSSIAPFLTLSSSLIVDKKSLSKVRDHLRLVIAPNDISTAVIVPSSPGPNTDLWLLASRLGAHVLGPLPSTTSIYSCKSGMRRIFNTAGVEILPGKSDIIDSSDILSNLIDLMFTFPQYSKWALICEDCFAGASAIIDLDKDTDLKNLRSNIGRDGGATELRTSLFACLSSILSSITTIAFPFYSKVSEINNDFELITFPRFLEFFDKSGGCIEAIPENICSYPRVSMLITPSSFILLTTYDMIPSNHFRFIAAISPQSSMIHLALTGASLDIVEVCRQKGIIGFIDIQFISVISQGLPLLYASHIEIGHSEWLSVWKSVDCVVRGCFDTETGVYSVKHAASTGISLSTQRSFVFSLPLFHQNLSLIGDYVNFSKKLRDFSINFTPNLRRVAIPTFNVERRIGSLFLPVGPLSRGFLVPCSITVTSDEGLALMKSISEFVTHDLSTHRGPCFSVVSPNEFSFGDLKTALSLHEKRPKFVFKIELKAPPPSSNYD
ncbi:hypothetical protein RCL1_003696 [Eukaryota sp. TZLM3-RCL]